MNEDSPRARVALARLLETALLLEQLLTLADPGERLALLAALGRRGRARALARASRAAREASPSGGALPEASAGAPSPGPTASPHEGDRERRPRAPRPLWSGESDGAEARAVLEQVRSVLEWSNREFGATFPVDRSVRDVQRYPYATVRAAVSNVLLKKARGYSFSNPGAVLWDGITLKSYRYDEFSVARLEEVLRLCAEREAARPPEPAPPPPVEPRPRAPSFAAERRRREVLRAAYDALSEGERAGLDREAEALARGELEGRSVTDERLALRVADIRNELLERAHPELVPAIGGT